MSQINEINLDKDGITIWAVGCDDFWISERDFKMLRKAMKEWGKMYKKKKGESK